MSVTSEEMIDACFDIALDVRDGKLTPAEASRQVNKKTGMNAGSAKMYIGVVLAMLAGKPFPMNISDSAVDRYMDRIGTQFGAEAEKKAAQSLLIKFINEQKKSRYLNGALSVLSHDEIDGFLDGYGVSHDIWPMK